MSLSTRLFNILHVILFTNICIFSFHIKIRRVITTNYTNNFITELLLHIHTDLTEHFYFSLLRTFFFKFDFI